MITSTFLNSILLHFTVLRHPLNKYRHTFTITKIVFSYYTYN